MEHDSCHDESHALWEEMQRRIQYADSHPEELLDWENVKGELLTRRLEAHRGHPEQAITREALEAKWEAKWDWKPSL